MRCTILAGVAVMRTDSRTNAIRGMSVTPWTIGSRPMAVDKFESFQRTNVWWFSS